MKKARIYFYIPNLIGYMRVVLNCVAFGFYSSNKWIFSALYLTSFTFDGLDGFAARRLNQASTFGAVLDMVTDRVSTACLLVVLSQIYRPGLVFMALLSLDIASHWLQMFSAFLVGKASHKDINESANWLLRKYYGNRMLMAYCCVANEALYIVLFLLSENHTQCVMDAVWKAVRCDFSLMLASVPLISGWAVKQAVNLIQMKTAADACVMYDIVRKKKP